MSLLESFGKELIDGSAADIFAKMIQFFDEDKWQYRVLPETTMIETHLRGKNGYFRLFAHARVDEGLCVFLSVLGHHIPDEIRPRLMEFVTRANYGLNVGNFEFDLDSGELRFKTLVDVKGIEYLIEPQFIKRMVYVNVLTMDHYIPGIMRAIYGSEPVRDILQEIEING